MNETVHVLISGHVQGVFFRIFVFGKANNLNLRGWVKNTQDDRVEAIFQGPEEKIQQMISWCHQGSPSSKVEKIKVSKLKQEQVFSNFEIR